MFLFCKNFSFSNKTIVCLCTAIILCITTSTVSCIFHTELRKNETDKKGRQNKANLLSEVIQNQIFKLQNPDNCETARKLLCTVDRCGFGCQIHSFVACFLQGYRTNRTVILINTKFLYGVTDWETFFKPVSICQNQTQIETLKDEALEESYKFNYNKHHWNFTIPDDFAISVQQFHKDPTAWWIGQFMKYFIKLKTNVQSNIERKMKLLRFKSPIVGVHIRTTDKVKEVKLHDADEYMTAVEHIFNLYFGHVKGKTKLFVISDTKQPIEKIKENYPKYELISDLNDSNWNKTHSRKTSSTVMSILMDIFLLSKCDFVVCTFSSNVCRFAYELKQITCLDAPDQFFSLDKPYYFIGMKGKRNSYVDEDDILM